MLIKFPLWKFTLFILFLFFTCLIGCGEEKPTMLIEDPTHLALEKIGNAYIRAEKPPQNINELLTVMKMCNFPKELLKSPNDGQEFVIVYGVNLRMLKATGNQVPIVAFEKMGKDGKRYVLRGQSSVSQLSDSELQTSKFPDGYKLPF